MSKMAKISLIVFIIGIVGLGVTVGVVVGTGNFGPKDNTETFEAQDGVEQIALSVYKASVEFEEADEVKVVSEINLWADEDIQAEDVAVVTQSSGVLTLTEIPPTNNFFGLFKQPYELKITIHAPRGVIDDIDWSNAK